LKTRAVAREIEPIGYTLEEIAEALRIHPETAAKLLRTGELPGRKIGREWRISPKAVEEWLASGHDDEE
jgi:excisionase family DNA binding protein